MDFEKLLQDDMDLISERIEAGLENSKMQTKAASEELENMIRRVVKEELADVVKDIKKTMERTFEKTIKEFVKNSPGKSTVQTVSANTMERPKIERVQKVTYDILHEAKFGSGMTCGGWTFFANGKEGRHLWAVNEKGTEYCELYPKTISRVTRVEGGFVYFTDADYKEHHFTTFKNNTLVAESAV